MARKPPAPRTLDDARASSNSELERRPAGDAGALQRYLKELQEENAALRRRLPDEPPRSRRDDDDEIPL